MKLKSAFVHRKTFKHRRGTTKRATSKRNRITVKRKRKHTKRRRTNKKYLVGGVNTPEKPADLLTTPQKPDVSSTPSPDRSDPLNPGYSFMTTPQDVAENPLYSPSYKFMSSPDDNEEIGPLTDPKMADPKQYASMPSPNATDEKIVRKPGQRPSKSTSKNELDGTQKILFGDDESP